MPANLPNWIPEMRNANRRPFSCFHCIPVLVPMLLIASLAAGAGSALATETVADPGKLTQTLFLTRHAEKALDGSQDPPLTAAGELRAQRLSEWLLGLHPAAVRPVAIWSTNWKRTRATVAPLAAQLQVEPGIYDPEQQAEFARQLLESGANALVSGHSDTIPELAQLLCGCTVAEIDDLEYNRLYRLTVSGDAVQLEILDQTELGITP